MADSFTSTYTFTLPEVGGSPDTWGTKINNNWTTLDTALSTLNGAALKRGANLSDLTNVAAARTSLELKGAATCNVGTASNEVAAGSDSRIVGAAQKDANLADLTSKATARTNLDLKGAATCDVGTASGQVAAGNDSRILGALQSTSNLSELTDKGAARTNLGLGFYANLSGPVPVSSGGTGAIDAASARTNLGLGAVENKTSATIRGELSKANVDTALGKTCARVNAGTGGNAGLISWGAAAPPALDEGQIYLRHA